MLSRMMISMLVLVAFAASPASLSARQCILSNTSSDKACQSSCCGNQTCCATSPKNSAPTQPLAKSGSDQQSVAASPSVIAVAVLNPAAETSSIFSSRDRTAHSPPPLSLLCIRLI